MGRTTAGTQVETDLRHEKTYKTVREILVNAIEELRTHAKKTKVLVIPGNHDHNATWHMGDSLECYFAKYPDVEVDNTPRPRKYHTFGTALLGFTHGDKGKRADLPMLMATEVPELFGKSKFREWYTGHNHVEVTHEKNGIVVRILSALCPPDAWHAENGYVGNRRSSQAFQWDKIEGLVGTVIYTDGDDKIGK
jgi:DNA repair exonuclease SbcCD nuclease subunit